MSLSLHPGTQVGKEREHGQQEEEEEGEEEDLLIMLEPILNEGFSPLLPDIL